MPVKCPEWCFRFVPEFTTESTRTFFIIKSVLVIVLTSCLFLFENYLDTRVFDTDSEITFATILVVIIFNITVAFLIIVYVPYMWHITPFWYSLTITIVYITLLLYMTLESLIEGNIEGVDTPSLDLWSVVHFMAGVWLGFILPFIPLCYVISVWEVLEADWTSGLGDGESVGNHVVDVVVAVIGWLITVLLSMYLFPRFKCKQTTLNCLGKRDESQADECLIKWVQTFYRIPWISARAASCNKCYWHTNWETHQHGQSRDVDTGQAETQMAEVVR